MLNRADAKRLTQGAHWFRFWMPYQFVKLPSRRYKHLYLPVNRNYKPLGYLGDEHIDYEMHSSEAVMFRRDPHYIQGVWTDPEHLYLYDSNPNSRADYFARLERLMRRLRRVAGATMGNRRTGRQY